MSRGVHDMERVRAKPGLFVVCFRNGVIMKLSPLLDNVLDGIAFGLHATGCVLK